MITDLEILSNDSIRSKESIVSKILEGKKVIVAFSGGVDSTVMAYLSDKYAKSTLLVMQVGSSVAIGEKEQALDQANQLGLPIEFIEYDEIDYSEKFSENPHNRCYYCKHLLHTFLNKIKEEKNYDNVVTGTNYSDLDGHRPGHQATEEKGALNPLVEAELTKQEIRWIAREANLRAWDKPASACLASRFVTGVEITKEGLNRVAKAEHYLKTTYNLKILRVRDHGELARIEIGDKEYDKLMDKTVMRDIHEHLVSLGFEFVTLDLQGYRNATPTSI